MAGDGAVPTTPVWPIPKFRFEVRWGSTVMHFQEISGLDVETQPMELRHGDSPAFSVTRMPGIKRHSDVTLSKGVVKSDNRFWDWLDQIKMNPIKRALVTITLLDEDGARTMVWTLANAWLNKITGTDLKSPGGEVAVETIVISHEGMTVASS